MLTVMVLSLFLLGTLYECATVLKQAAKKVKILHLSIMLVSFCVLMLYSLNVPVPSPSGLIVRVIKAIFKVEA